MVKTDSEPVSEKELKEESSIESVELKDGAGYGDLQSLNAQPDQTNRDSETYVGRRAPEEAPKEIKRSETYIQERKSYSMGMTDQNKLKNTKLGDHINYYDNGVSGNGIVTKMSGQFIQIHKDDGKFYNININDTFHVSDILINKTWDAMSLEERTDELMKIKAYSPRFLSKTWDQLPRELKEVMKVNKSSIEDGALGNTGNSPTTGVSTKIPFDAPKDYEGASHAEISPDTAFEYEDVKPEAGKEPQAPAVKLDEQGLIKTGEFVYSDNPQGYKLPPKPTTKGYGMRYGVKYINQEEDK